MCCAILSGQFHTDHGSTYSCVVSPGRIEPRHWEKEQLVRKSNMPHYVAKTWELITSSFSTPGPSGTYSNQSCVVSAALSSIPKICRPRFTTYNVFPTPTICGLPIQIFTQGSSSSPLTCIQSLPVAAAVLTLPAAQSIVYSLPPSTVLSPYLQV